MHGCVWSQQTCGSRLLCSYSFCGRGLRVLTLSDPGQLSARAALFPKGEREHALRPHFASSTWCLVVGPEYSKHADYGTLSFRVFGVPHT